jgi:excisionase family DNA binding protein
MYGEDRRISKMPIAINGQKYYRTSEACRMVGISRTTLLRWLRQGNLKLPEYRDRRKWRLFTEDDVDRLNHEANRISSIGQYRSEND